MSWWQLLAPLVASETPVCLRHDTGAHHGVLDLVRISADGSCVARFTDGTSLTIPALKEKA